MTQLAQAKRGIITEEMRQVAEEEHLEPQVIAEGVAKGSIIIPKNINRKFNPRGIGKGLKTKVNANFGTSEVHNLVEEELEKLKAAVEAKADSVMDLSTGGDLDAIRQEILKHSPVMVGTVPIYQTMVEFACRGEPYDEITPDDIFSVIEKHAQQGVDFITVHCGVTRNSVERLEKEGRIGGVVSRGGAFLIRWMKRHDQENPLYQDFGRLVEIARNYDVTLSLGDGLRPGAIADATDRCQVQELVTLGELAHYALDQNVQVMIEGPGHIPLDQIVLNVQLEKALCRGAPFYVLGPLPTDIAPGYDHITAAIGGAIAAAAGADFLCYVTPAEHLRLPTVEDVREGVIAARIAAHCGDVVKGVRGARELDKDMSGKRKALDWEGMYKLAIDPERAREMRRQSETYIEKVCSMCGKFCSIKMDSQRDLKKDHNKSTK
ncbi:MAG: phosphomethylpyrimidine synthase ThiC [Candidatus Aminicenantes bacterium]|nr:phosphomethylpyrimidine synthase ThiC [Candidatus Aminicenantes bacterium]MDH5714002.1 phosphomethylpyrimidine synthase ThiC [Candidatus Aminicenantes bacterium]